MCRNTRGHTELLPNRNWPWATPLGDDGVRIQSQAVKPRACTVSLSPSPLAAPLWQCEGRRNWAGCHLHTVSLLRSCPEHLSCSDIPFPCHSLIPFCYPVQIPSPLFYAQSGGLYALAPCFLLGLDNGRHMQVIWGLREGGMVRVPLALSSTRQKCNTFPAASPTAISKFSSNPPSLCLNPVPSITPPSCLIWICHLFLDLSPSQSAAMAYLPVSGASFLLKWPRYCSYMLRLKSWGLSPACG